MNIIIIISHPSRINSTHLNNPVDASVALHADPTGHVANGVAEVRVVPDTDSHKYCSVDWKITTKKHIKINHEFHYSSYSSSSSSPLHSPVHVRWWLQSHMPRMLLHKVHSLVPMWLHMVRRNSHRIRWWWSADSLVLVKSWRWSSWNKLYRCSKHCSLFTILK